MSVLPQPIDLCDDNLLYVAAFGRKQLVMFLQIHSGQLQNGCGVRRLRRHGRTVPAHILRRRHLLRGQMVQRDGSLVPAILPAASRRARLLLVGIARHGGIGRDLLQHLRLLAGIGLPGSAAHVARVQCRVHHLQTAGARPEVVGLDVVVALLHRGRGHLLVVRGVVHQVLGTVARGVVDIRIARRVIPAALSHIRAAVVMPIISTLVHAWSPGTDTKGQYTGSYGHVRGQWM